MAPSSGQITVILQRWNSDRASANEALTPIVYGELIAAAYLRRRRPDQTLQPTALIHEAYHRLVQQESANFQDRSHFFTAVCELRYFSADCKWTRSHLAPVKPGCVAPWRASGVGQV